ncbi:hypothetical protein OE88DRAFT_1211732 [Heliocybe sulcata]|uniref:Ubiquitin-like domain-containing protein n=1 Tax=Heliocybe sulcata TaxID=5364 RepID=A0A5C3MLC5_9AGAM|nr:hypothetical protein OE88DRAFT_1211732 [Heliocybe sulcata]
MSLTRVRLGSTDPPLKAWFSVPNHVATVRDLKKSLCADIDALHDVTPDRVTLLLDEFELLDDSPINVLRDGDLLLVQCRQDQTRTKSAKRKAEESGLLRNRPMSCLCPNTLQMLIPRARKLDAASSPAVD